MYVQDDEVSICVMTLLVKCKIISHETWRVATKKEDRGRMLSHMFCIVRCQYNRLSEGCCMCRGSCYVEEVIAGHRQVSRLLVVVRLALHSVAPSA